MLLSHRIRVGGDTLHSRETADASAADGPQIILVHGVGATARYFRPLLQELDGRAPAAAVELPGIGSSTSSELPRDIPQRRTCWLHNCVRRSATRRSWSATRWGHRRWSNSRSVIPGWLHAWS
jgi:pimeloyl-ACP methyl ester carboxylesterase